MLIICHWNSSRFSSFLWRNFSFYFVSVFRTTTRFLKTKTKNCSSLHFTLDSTEFLCWAGWQWVMQWPNALLLPSWLTNKHTHRRSFQGRTLQTRFASILFKLYNVCKLILRKITKTVATRSHILKLICTKFDFDWGTAPDPTGELTALPQTL